MVPGNILGIPIPKPFDEVKHFIPSSVFLVEAAADLMEARKELKG